MDDDLRVVDAPKIRAPRAGDGEAISGSPAATSTRSPAAGTPSAEDATDGSGTDETTGELEETEAVDEIGETGEAAPRRGRVWLRRVGVALVVLIAGVALGFQVQAARVRAETTGAETTQRIAELDEETARIRLASVGDRVEIAQSNEADAQQVLEGSRAAMTAQGLEEATLHDAQVAKAQQVRDVRSQVKTVHAAIAVQKRLQPAAGTCVFDLLRGLGRSSAPDTDACRTTADLAAG